MQQPLTLRRTEQRGAADEDVNGRDAPTVLFPSVVSQWDMRHLLPSHDLVAPLSTFKRFLADGGAATLVTGSWGLEREVLRVEAGGQLARSPHPFPNEETRISVDFAENQAELITLPRPSPEAALTDLAALHRALLARSGGELLWPFSLPGRWDDPDRVQAATFEGRAEWEMQRMYRRDLEKRHGKARQVICGIHYNFSFSDAFFAAWRAPAGATEPERAMRDAAYFGLMRNFVRHQFVFNALTGVSPPGDDAFWRALLAYTRPDLRREAEDCRDQISSVRLSPLGYALPPDVEAEIGVTFASLAEYRAKIAEAIQPSVPGRAPLLAHEREFYSAVRPKPAIAAAHAPDGQPAPGRERLALLEALGRHGVGYLEFRIFDLDPFEPLGIAEDSLYFFHVFVLACLFLPSPLISAAEADRIAARRRWSTLCGDTAPAAGRDDDETREEAAALFAAMTTIVAALPAPYTRAVAARWRQWQGSAPRPIERLRQVQAETGQSQLELGLALARQHRQALTHER